MDDEPLFLGLMRLQLESCGYQVESAGRGEDAVDCYRRALESGRPFAAVILDLIISEGWGGEKTLAELLTLNPDVKALICSSTLHGSNVDYRKIRFRGTLRKPYSLVELQRSIEVAIDGSEGKPE